MTLGEKQRMFPRLLTALFEYAEQRQAAFTLGEAWRPPELVELYAKDGRGSAGSVHPDRLAIDLNLFLWDGARWVYQTTTEAHAPFGIYWKSLHPLARWGGDFKTPDGNHYSIMHGGRA